MPFEFFSAWSSRRCTAVAVDITRLESVGAPDGTPLSHTPSSPATAFSLSSDDFVSQRLALVITMAADATPAPRAAPIVSGVTLIPTLLRLTDVVLAHHGERRVDTGAHPVGHDGTHGQERRRRERDPGPGVEHERVRRDVLDGPSDHESEPAADVRAELQARGPAHRRR